jgi:hypothetical protein
MPGRRTRIDAGHIIAYQDGGHRHLRDGVVVEGQDIVHVAPPTPVRLTRWGWQ